MDAINLVITFIGLVIVSVTLFLQLSKDKPRVVIEKCSVTSDSSLNNGNLHIHSRLAIEFKNISPVDVRNCTVSIDFFEPNGKSITGPNYSITHRDIAPQSVLSYTHHFDSKPSFSASDLSNHNIQDGASITPHLLEKVLNAKPPLAYVLVRWTHARRLSHTYRSEVLKLNAFNLHLLSPEESDRLPTNITKFHCSSKKASRAHFKDYLRKPKRSSV